MQSPGFCYPAFTLHPVLPLFTFVRFVYVGPNTELQLVCVSLSSFYRLKIIILTRACVRAATPSWSAQTRVAMDCLAPLQFGDTASRSTFGKTANLKLQQDVRFPFTQLMKTRSEMVEGTIYHQHFTLKHSPGPKTGSETLQCPIGPHGGAHAPTVRKGSWLLLHGSSVQTASLPSPLPPFLHPSIQPPRANSCQTVSRRQTDDIII